MYTRKLLQSLCNISLHNSLCDQTAVEVYQHTVFVQHFITQHHSLCDQTAVEVYHHTVFVQHFITQHQSLSDQTAVAVYHHTVFVLVATELPRRDYRVMIYDKFIKGPTVDESLVSMLHLG